MPPIGQPGALTERERFLFETTGYLIIPDALTPEETEACLQASLRAHSPYPRGQWRQIGHLHETEPAIEQLIDHPAVFPKVRALLGDYFILQSTWCTVQPASTKGGGYHQDGSSVYDFRRLATPTPLMQLAHQGELMAFLHNGFWHPMDSSRDYKYLNDVWSEGRAPWKTWTPERFVPVAA